MGHKYRLLLTAFLCLFLFPELASAASDNEEKSSLDIINQLNEHRIVVMGMVSTTMSFIGLAFYLALRHQNKRMMLDAQDDTMRLRQLNRMNAVSSGKGKSVSKEQTDVKPVRAQPSKRMFGKA